MQGQRGDEPRVDAGGADDARFDARRRRGLGAVVIAVLAAMAVTVAIGIARSAGAPAETVEVDGGTSDAAADRETWVYVHVAGAVAAPGLYRLSAASRVVDAVAAAGGFASDADRTAVNLARPVVDGEQVVVPVEGAAPAPDAAGDGRIDLNTATAAELDELPRIGEAMAQRIIQWREANGRFTSVEDLLAVPGIGDKMLETLRPLVTV
jgi:competence protein ComEA